MSAPDPALVAELTKRCISDPEVVAQVMTNQGLGLADLAPMPLPDDPSDVPD